MTTNGAVSADALGITADELAVLLAGLIEWSGPARPTDEFAVAMGFGSAAAMPGSAMALRERLKADGALAPAEWLRVLLATEVAFASDVVGSGVEWATTTGLSDSATVRHLRAIQRRLASTTFPALRAGKDEA